MFYFGFMDDISHTVRLRFACNNISGDGKAITEYKKTDCSLSYFGKFFQTSLSRTSDGT